MFTVKNNLEIIVFPLTLKQNKILYWKNSSEFKLHKKRFICGIKFTKIGESRFFAEVKGRATDREWIVLSALEKERHEWFPLHSKQRSIRLKKIIVFLCFRQFFLCLSPFSCPRANCSGRSLLSCSFLNSNCELLSVFKKERIACFFLANRFIAHKKRAMRSKNQRAHSQPCILQ